MRDDDRCTNFSYDRKVTRCPPRVLSATALLGAPLFALVVVAACSSFESAVDPPVDEAGEGGIVVTDTGLADSTPVDSAVPKDAAPRDFLYVFVSSAEHIGQFPPPVGGSAVNGFDGANAFCKSLADVSTFDQLRSLKWVAWLAADGQKEPWRRLPVKTGTRILATPYRLRDGTEVFPKGFLFETTTDDAGLVVRAVPEVAIVLDEQTAPSHTNLSVWTGTTREMQTHPANCRGWNADVDGGGFGGLLGSTSNTAFWAASGDLGAPPCTEMHHLYCFEVP